jgi:hypothetical protein
MQTLKERPVPWGTGPVSLGSILSVAQKGIILCKLSEEKFWLLQ